MNIHVFQVEDGLPPMLASCIGRRVFRAWLLPTGQVLIRFEGHCMLMVSASGSVPGQRLALIFAFGCERQGSNLQELDGLAVQTHYTKTLRDRRLTGLGKDTLIFDDLYGVKFTADGIRWLRMDR